MELTNFFLHYFDEMLVIVVCINVLYSFTMLIFIELIWPAHVFNKKNLGLLLYLHRRNFLEIFLKLRNSLFVQKVFKIFLA